MAGRLKICDLPGIRTVYFMILFIYVLLPPLKSPWRIRKKMVFFCVRKNVFCSLLSQFLNFLFFRKKNELEIYFLGIHQVAMALSGLSQYY